MSILHGGSAVQDDRPPTSRGGALASRRPVTPPRPAQVHRERPDGLLGVLTCHLSQLVGRNDRGRSYGVVVVRLPLIAELAPLSDADPGGVVLLRELPLYRAQMNSAFPADIVDLRVAEHGSDVRVVTVTGEVDMVTAPELAACLIAQLAVVQVVVVNLDGVRFLASAGLTVLFEMNELAKQKGRDLRLVCNSCTANRALEATGLRTHLPFVDSMADALTSGRGPLAARANGHSGLA